ncbi:DUF975 family protein [Clostridium sp. UBA1056]|uniref:DUF975 family protein n=1 Tax=unclassified Clostridium TaxID=2614128 RepID=UPI0032178C66
MVNRKELKSKSKEQLRGQWKIPVLITLIISIIQIISSYTMEIFVDKLPIYILLLILNLLITLSIGIMVNSFYLKISRDKKVGFSDIFISWKTFGKGIGIEVLLGLIIIPIVIIIAIIIGVVWGLYMSTAIINSLTPSYGIMIGITILLTLILCIPLIILGLYFFPAVILVCEDNNRGIIQCIKESLKLMKGNLWNLFVLQLSFIGWAILCIIPTIFIAILTAFSLNEVAVVILSNIASIGFLWLVPYMNTTLLNFFNEISGATNNPMYNEITSLN